MEESSSKVRTTLALSQWRSAMDIEGAKALKRRLGLNGADEAPSAVEPAEVPADAPPVYRWTGKVPAATAPSELEDDAPRSASLFSRLSPSFR
jgi:hypothetical protein